MKDSNMNTRVTIFIIVALIVGIGIGIFVSSSRNKKPLPPLLMDDGKVITTYKDLVKVFSPKPNEVLSETIIVTGEARGNWFFEGSFPVALHDDKGDQIGIAVAQTTSGEWMTGDYVPFKATLHVMPTETSGTTGKIVFEKDNPSGLAQHDDKFEIPILLPTPSNEKTVVKIFFGNSQLDPNTLYCDRVYEIERTVSKTLTGGRAALQELLKGPSLYEKSQGFFSVLPSDVALSSLKIENRVMYADFNTLPSGGSCLVATARAQIEETLKQFQTVGAVVISVSGSTEGVLEP